MSSETAPLQPEVKQPLAGKKLYSPGVLAAYTVLASLPVTLVLYGLNVKARGQRGLGLAMVVLGIACIGALIFLPGDAATSHRTLVLPISVVGAFAIYKTEKGPVQRALCQGAVLARWWPPALFLLATGGMILVTNMFL